MGYEELSRRLAEELRASGHAVILAIESSCDDTAAAVIKDGRIILSQAAASQIAIHQKYGGVVPEVASRCHVEAVNPLVGETLERAGLRFADVDAIAVTYGPGLVGALLTGVSAGKAFAYAAGKPLIGVNHMEGHISANYLNSDWEPPFLCLVVSGGHTMLVAVEDYGKYRILGTTLDDAAGEAFDKVAKLLGLPYPGGPEIQRIAEGVARQHRFTRPKLSTRPLDFSFSGLKTGVMQRADALRKAGELDVAQLAADFQYAVVDNLVDNTLAAMAETGMKKVALAGGVAANGALRGALERAVTKAGGVLHVPAVSLCTDNAAMIGSAAYYALMRGEYKGLDLNAVPGLALPEVT